MHGYGFRSKGAKACTEDMLQLDVRKMQRSGGLLNNMDYGWSWSRAARQVASIHLNVQSDLILIEYRRPLRDGEWRSATYAVELDWTPCHLGGDRVWWRCPVPDCNRRVAVLYAGTRIACRHCQSLVYRCQRESAEDRAARQANKVRSRLGWKAGVLNLPGDKPKGMHWKTFARLQAEHDANAQIVLGSIAKSLGLLRAGLPGAR
jgi:hypothetical protein